MDRTVFSNLWHHLISFCFPHDPGNNRWKSQLLRVLSKRSLCPDKAAQVLLAKGIAHRTCYPETCQIMPGMERLHPWDAGSHWHLFSLENSWRILVIVDGAEPECCIPFSAACQAWVWFPVTQACGMILGSLPRVGEKGMLALKWVSSEGSPFCSSVIDNQKVSLPGRSTAATCGCEKDTEQFAGVLTSLSILRINMNTPPVSTPLWPLPLSRKLILWIPFLVNTSF